MQIADRRASDRIRTYFFWLAAISLTYAILAKGKGFFVPVAISIVLWYLINALAAGFGRIPFGRKRMPSWLCYMLSLISIPGVFYGMLTLLTGSMAELTGALPAYQRNLERLSAEILNGLGLEEFVDVRRMLREFDIASGLSRVVIAATGLLGNIGIVLVYIFFLFLEQKSFGSKLSALAEHGNHQGEIGSIFIHIESDIRLYTGIKVLTSGMTGIISYVIMKAVGLDFAELWAMLIFVFNFIPTVGSIIATIFPTIIALVQFDGAGPFLVVGLGIGSLQFVIGNILEPRLMGSRLNLSPLAIVLSLTLFATMWGFVGMMLSVPVMVILLIVFSHFPQTRPFAILLSRRGTLALSGNLHKPQSNVQPR